MSLDGTPAAAHPHQAVKPSLSAQPVGYLLAQAAEARAMAMTARSPEAAAAFVHLAERLEAIAAKQLDLPDNAGGA